MNSRSRLLLFRRKTSSPVLPSFPQLANNVLLLNATDPSTLYSDAAKTVNTAAGGDVYVWADKSGQGNDVSQAATGKYPLRQVGVQNGQDVVRMDGIDDFLQGVYANALTQPFTVWLVAKLAEVTGSICTAIDGYDTSNRMWLRVGSGGNLWSVSAGSGIGGGIPDTSWHLFRVEFNTANSALWIDNVEIATGDAGSDTPTGITVGAAPNGSSNWPGDIAMVVIQDGLATTEEIAAMNAYVADTFGITMGV